MRTVEIEGLRLGEGVRIAVPVMAGTAEEIVRAGEMLRAHDSVDLLEWRVDAFEGWQSAQSVRAVLRRLRAAAGEKPVLFTLRTAKEGGLCAPDEAQYAALLLEAAREGAALIDVEMYACAQADALVEQLHALGARVIGSSHDFEKTPPRAEMLWRLMDMQARGADIPKLAVMPRTPDDVLSLMGAAQDMRARAEAAPFIALSMGRLGRLTRICCAEMGACMTFGSVMEASAPGQVEAGRLRAALDALSAAMI